MVTITSLNDYLAIVCDPEDSSDSQYEYDSHELSRMNEVVKWLIMGIEKEPPEKVKEFLEVNYKYIYGYKYKKERGQKLETIRENQYEWFYRGVDNLRYLLSPGIYRKDEFHDESYYYHEISVRCPEVFRAYTNLEKLTYMQHYGCPTRLLDVTSNPLVALYFACINAKDKDGVVYVFEVPKGEVLYENSDRIQILSNLAEYRKEQQDEMWGLAYRNILQDKFKQNSNGKYQDKVIEQLYHSIKRQNGAFEREIIPYDVLKPQFVKPNKDNPRILKQDGAFIACGLSLNEEECDMKIRKCMVREIIINSESKEDLLNTLERIGINEATLFPEVDKIANYLRNRRI